MSVCIALCNCCDREELQWWRAPVFRRKLQQILCFHLAHFISFEFAHFISVSVHGVLRVDKLVYAVIEVAEK